MNADRIRVLADQVGRLTIDRRDPERFFMARAELREELRRAADDLERNRSGPHGRAA